MTTIRKYYYGDIPESQAGSGATNAGNNHASHVQAKDWPLWEIFIRSRQGLDHKHVGSLHAADAKMAIENARDVYTRRMEGVSIWAVPSRQIFASDPGEGGSLYEPSIDKIYRHPTFYELPEELGHM